VDKSPFLKNPFKGIKKIRRKIGREAISRQEQDIMSHARIAGEIKIAVAAYELPE